MCFAVFIVACGLTHVLEIWTIWEPVYWLSGLVKAITALASLPTACLLVRLIPEALRWPSPAALKRANGKLELEITERKRAEAEVRQANDLLEIRVSERTRELEVAYQSLRQAQEASIQQERLQALGRMASGIAHDINNALTPATLYAQSLLDHDSSLNDEARGDLAVIQQAIGDVTQTVTRIKDFYRRRESNATSTPVDMKTSPRAGGCGADPWHVGLTCYPRSAVWSSTRAPRILRSHPAYRHGRAGEIRDAITNLGFQRRRFDAVRWHPDLAVLCDTSPRHRGSMRHRCGYDTGSSCPLSGAVFFDQG